MEILWWHWLVLGLLLVVAELAAPGGFYIIFFGIGALLVAMLAGLGVGEPLWVQILLFAVFSVASLALFRARLLKRFQLDPQAPLVDQLVGAVGLVLTAMGPGDTGKVELRGSAWNARNLSEEMLGAGTRVRVVRVDGLMLMVGPEGAR
jgi:inner membrane protein